MSKDRYWTVRVQFESGYVTKIAGVAPDGDSAMSGALAICEKEWNQAADSVEVIGLTRGGVVDFTVSSAGKIKIL